MVVCSISFYSDRQFVHLAKDMVLHCELDKANCPVIGIVPGILGFSCHSRAHDHSVDNQPQVYRVQIGNHLCPLSLVVGPIERGNMKGEG